MASWVESDAKRWAVIFRDSAGIWKSLRDSIEQAVTDYTRIYSPPGEIDFQLSTCAPPKENCITVKSLSKQGSPQIKAIEVQFNPDNCLIYLNGKEAFSIRFSRENLKVELMRGEEKVISVEDASRELLEPLFFVIPQRRPNILI